MLILEGQVVTERASRYLTQFCRHAAAMGGDGPALRPHSHGTAAHRQVRVTAECSDTHGTVTFAPWGRCMFAATAETLALRIEAADEDGLRRIQDVVTRDLDRFSHRDPVTVAWQVSGGDRPSAGPHGRSHDEVS